MRTERDFLQQQKESPHSKIGNSVSQNANPVITFWEDPDDERDSRRGPSLEQRGELISSNSKCN
eukprot:41981-Prymnesium_polylepis.2